MHEIPNLPFPSLHPTEQPTPQQASDKQPEAKEAKPVERESRDSRRTPLYSTLPCRWSKSGTASVPTSKRHCSSALALRKTPWRPW